MLDIQNILLVEDLEEDQILIKRCLFKAEIFANVVVCDTKESFLRHLKYSNPDLILLNYHIPTFEFDEAFELTKCFDPKIPIIYVTGSIPHSIASETSLSKADAFVIKDHLSELPIVIHSVWYHKFLENEKEKSSDLAKRMNDIDKRLRKLMEKNNVYMEFLRKNDGE